MATKKQPSHLGAGLLAGALLGVATGLFLQSKKGKEMTKDLTKKAVKFQTKLTKELQNVEHLTKEKYEDVVDNVMDYYMKTKEIAKSEVPEVRNFLVKHWKQIEKTMKSGK